MRHTLSDRLFRRGLLQTTALVASSALTLLVAASGARAQTATVSGSDVNVLNLLSPFLSLNSTAIGQATLQANLAQSIAINNNSSAAQRQLAISDENLLSRPSGNTITGLPGVTYGIAANLAGGLPAQAMVGSLTPQQTVGGLGVQLGQIYQTGVFAGTSGPLANTVRLLDTGYNGLTSLNLGVAKNYFGNGNAANSTSGSTPAIAPAGYTLPTFNGLPNTTDSVYDIAYGVKNTGSGQDIYGSSRPVQVSPGQINLFDPNAIVGLTTNPSFPSGHTTYAYTESILIAMLVPELYQSMVLRASEYGNSRIVLGVHYPLDIIASRSLSQYELAQALSNPAYVNNTTVTKTAINMPSLFAAASTELRNYLATQCGASIATCATSTANTAGDPYVPSAANQALYQQRLTYGLPTLTYDQAPREAAPTGGPDASILLATVYGGSTAAAKAIALPTGGSVGNLSTDTINQIIVNTEGQALAAFYGSSLSYWSRIDLYSAAGYFQNVIGTVNMAAGDVVNTNVTVANTGVLAGSATINGNTTVQSGGALSPGSAAGGTLRVNGSLAFQSGSQFIAQTSPTAAATAVVSGTATLAGTVTNTAPNSTTRFNTTSTILTAGTVSGKFDNFVAAAGTTGSLAYVGNTVQLTLASGLGQINGLNRNARNVGAAIDSALNAGGNVGVLGQVFSGNIAQNLQQVSGETATGAQQVTFDAMNQFMGAVMDPTLAGRSDAPVGNAPLGFAASDDDNALNYAASGKKRSKTERDAFAMFTKAKPIAPIVEPIWSVWAAGYGGSRDTDGNAAAGTGTTSSRIFGGVAGADYRLSRDTVIGFALGGGGSNYSVAGGGSGRSDLFQAGAFARHTMGPTYLSAALAYGWQDVNTDRFALGQRLQANFNANAYSGRLEGGYRFASPIVGIGLTAYAAGQFTTFDLPTYGETGTGGLALNYAGKTVTATRSELGLKGDKSFLLEDMSVLTLRGRAAWAHDFNNDRSVQATFQTLPGASFTVNGARAGADAALASASAEMKWRNGISVAATFDGEFSDNTRSYAGKGVLRYSW